MSDSPLRRRLRAAALAARRDRDRSLAGALGAVLAALENAEAAPVEDAPATAHGEHVAGAVAGLAGDVPRLRLTADQETALVSREVDELLVGAEQYAALGAADRAADLRRVAAAVRAAVAG